MNFQKNGKSKGGRWVLIGALRKQQSKNSPCKQVKTRRPPHGVGYRRVTKPSAVLKGVVRMVLVDETRGIPLTKYWGVKEGKKWGGKKQGGRAWNREKSKETSRRRIRIRVLKCARWGNGGEKYSRSEKKQKEKNSGRSERL